MAIPATLIPGDGIGPEIVASVRAILDALGSPFDQSAEFDHEPPEALAQRLVDAACVK